MGYMVVISPASFVYLRHCTLRLSNPVHFLPSMLVVHGSAFCAGDLLAGLFLYVLAYLDILSP